MDKNSQTQNKVYRQMPAQKKVELASQMFLLGQKLNQLKNNASRRQQNSNTRTASLSDS